MFTDVTVVDYIDKLATHELQLPAFAQNKKMEEVVALIIANMPVAPNATDYGTGQDTFATVFDTTRSTTRALTEVAKVTQSELGMTWVNKLFCRTRITHTRAKWVSGNHQQRDLYGRGHY